MALDEPHGNAGAVPERLRRRPDFLRAAKGKRFFARGLTLQAVVRPIAPPETRDRHALDDPETGGAQGQGQIGDTGRAAPCAKAPPRFGFTVTKQSGGAVKRNRIRRRLKEALRHLNPLPARPGHDYVILAKPEALGMSFQNLQMELMRALEKIHIRKYPPPIRPDHGGNAPFTNSAGDARRKNSKGRTLKE